MKLTKDQKKWLELSEHASNYRKLHQYGLAGSDRSQESEFHRICGKMDRLEKKMREEE